MKLFNLVLLWMLLGVSVLIGIVAAIVLSGLALKAVGVL